MNEWYFIVNPEAGHGKGLRTWRSIEKELQKVEVSYRSFLTQHEGHAEVLARQISAMQDDRLKRLIVIGGDGTIHEVLNGLKEIDHVQLSFVPAGHWNDAAKGLGIHRHDVLKEVKKQKRMLTKTFSLGSFQDHAESPQSVLFLNHIGVGFDAHVLRKTVHFRGKKWLKRLGLGFIIYPLSFLHSLWSFKPFDLALFIENEKKVFRQVWFVIVCNHPYYGGGLEAAPEVSARQPGFQTMVVTDLNPFKVLLFLSAMVFRKHLGMKGVTLFQHVEAYLEADEKILFHADGEVIGATPVFVKASERSLKLRA
ncbi:YegS/Rv2252/BmrU family lipid kinase [Bacillus safensis]|uniref:YegS/Rv2252/BmrU family lipid kinase n=1 Tax=Bacillus TaxID=1386 RepID=UPI0022713D4D|nr:YegS/Rv2252/BmrU family lipid kinase [Bacillus safensis]MCY1120162.1 YegS/Rv2252/BmrU family lipid kinase [Bacillus safensis]